MHGSITPLAIRKATFRTRLRGLDPVEVEEYLSLVADELTKSLQDVEALRRERATLAERLEVGATRERALQDTLLQAQRMSEDILSNARREAQLLVKEAEMTADKMVGQAMEQIGRLESRVAELRQQRRELQARCRAQVELFGRLLDEDIDDERNTAAVRSIRMPRREGVSGA